MLFASATLTWGAARRINAAPAGKRTVFVKPTVVVPDVTGQAFVFAKGTLEDAGFAWRVSGKVHGYSTNTVATQVPAAGTKLIDTGAPRPGRSQPWQIPADRATRRSLAVPRNGGDAGHSPAGAGRRDADRACGAREDGHTREA